MMEKCGGCSVVKPKLTVKNQQQPHQEQLPCPRCHSTITKFCYYNNYNFAQPRHLCKACRRYWTHGGTLRDIPMGGGSRKSAKRCRTSSYNSASTPSLSSSSHEFLNSAPLFLPSSPAYGGMCGGVSAAGGFTSLLTGNHGPGVWALSGGFGIGRSSGLLDETGFGPGRNTWAFGDMGYGGSNGSATVVGGNGGSTWQIETGGGVDCFGRPELAMSTPGNGLK